MNDSAKLKDAKPRHKLEDIKLAIRGRAIDVLRDVAGIPQELLDGRHHPCSSPKCASDLGGDDRFRLIDSARGAVLCNQCFSEKNGDAISAVMHFREVRLPEALALIGEYLGVTTSPPKQGKQRSAPNNRGGGNRATRASRATSTVAQPASESPVATSGRNEESVGKESPPTDPTDVRHEVYSLILSGLRLEDEHREALRQRGMTDAAIQAGGYRSVVAPSRTGEASRRIRAWRLEDFARREPLLLQVPGVVQDAGKPIRFSSPCGLLIPVRDTTGQIVALRIRLDAAGDGGKYRWISSRSRKHSDGPSPGTPCHVPRGITGPVEMLRITEGELKADIAFGLSGVPTVSIAGVNTWKRVLPLVDELQPQRILIALDADFRTNVAVAAAVRGLVTTLSESRDVAVETWQLEDGKGIDDLLAAGHSPTILDGDDVATLLTELPLSATAIASQSSRVEILVGTDEHRVNDEAVAAMAGDEELFARVGLLMRIVGEDTVQDGIVRPYGAKRMRHLLPQSLREAMTRQIRFLEERMTPQGDLVQKAIHPPGWCVSAVHARGEWRGVRPLRAIVACPTLRADGSILSTNGYDPLTGLFLSSAIELPPIPLHPTHDDAVRAADVLLNVTVDFPFAKPEHRAAWLAFVLTPLARHAFSGPSPLFLIDANTRGSGKSLLADVGGIIATGATLARMSNPKEDEECRKRITALALAGDSMVLIDNIVGNLGCASLDAALTSPDSWKDRILGKSEMVELPLSLTWTATGNNVMLEADTSRRTLHIRLDSPEENPEQRCDFRIPHLVAHIKQQRAALVAAGLTILSAYHAAGRPRMNLPAWGSFDEWSALIREAIVWCGLPDPGQTREELAKRSDLVSGVVQSIINQWPNIDPHDEGLTSSELLKHLEERRPEYDALREAVCELCGTVGDKLPGTKTLGNRLRRIRGRVVNGKALDSEDEHGKARWFVRPIKRPLAGCSSWTGCSVSPPAVSRRETLNSPIVSDEWEDVA